MRTMLNDFYQTLDPIAFTLGPLSVRWYGLAYIFGFVCAGVVIALTARRWRVRLDAYDVLSAVCAIAFGVIIGARLVYCLVYGDGYYLQHPLEILALSNGGMSFHGGLVGGFVGGAVFCAAVKMPLLTLADLVACGAPLGLLFGRCANFVNGELYGAPTTGPLGVDFLGTGVMYTPSQLYEAFLEGIVLFVVLFALSRKVPPRPRGFFFGVFLTLYACCRIAVEFVRLPDVQIGYFFGTWGTMGQLLCLPMLLLGVGFIVYSLKTKKPQQGLNYENQK